MEEIEGSGWTKRRQIVLRVIRESDKHLTANEVFDEARRLLSGISFATVYNSLTYLKNKGLITEIKLGTNANLYDRKLTRHDHAVCNNCGILVDMELTIPNKLFKEAASRSKFKPETIELTLRGLCPECCQQES
jgi:Fur family peroxide stress response transcriptional regulator